MKVLFVCLGNICRSPLAEAIFLHKIKEKNIATDFSADSCGTSDYHIGQSAHSRTMRNAEKNGIDIRHAARQLSAADFNEFDLIIAMDRSNYNNIVRLQNAAFGEGSLKTEIIMMRSFDPQGDGDVPDPYSGGERGFQEVFDILDRSIDGLIEDLVAKKDRS